MTDCVLVLNAGSSSLKFKIYRSPQASGAHIEARGQIEGIGTAATFAARDSADRPLESATLVGVHDVGTALVALAQWLRTRFHHLRVVGVGHRVVHGGSRCEPSFVTPTLVEELRSLIPLAPLHQPHSIAAIEAVTERLPGVPQVACFDTSFHRTQPRVATLVPLPREIRSLGVQRYGFHGLSYEYIASVLPRIAPKVADGRVIIAHLGSGASLCALKQRKSVDCTFGFTALDGLCMGTRPGAVDPGVILYLFRQLRMSSEEVETILYKRSGLLGISEISNDMRILLASHDPNARLAVDYFVFRVTKEIGALTAILGGLDAVIFTAGIGERSAAIRDRICSSSAWLGIDMDPQANVSGDLRISRENSPVSAWIIPTDEELMIALHTGAVLGRIETAAPELAG
jgi:acetate kinase